MTGNRCVGLTSWPGGEWEKAYVIFVGSELSFLKLVSVLIGLNGGVSNKFFLKASTAEITTFEVKCVFWLVEWN